MIKKIELVGHLIVDKVFSGSESYQTLGGIANVWDSLSKLNNSYVININPTSLGEAIIVVSKETNERVGRAILNKKTYNVGNIESDWCHIAYINQIHDLSFIDNVKSSIISADITKENPYVKDDTLNKLDYLFISREDLFDDLKTIGLKLKKGVICHDPKGSIFSDGNEIIEYKIPEDLFIKNANVLGAGDSFASSFIDEILKGNDNITSVIENSHKKTTDLIKQNETNFTNTNGR
jgi:hypothetical protein